MDSSPILYLDKNLDNKIKQYKKEEGERKIEKDDTIKSEFR